MLFYAFSLIFYHSDEFLRNFHTVFGITAAVDVLTLAGIPADSGLPLLPFTSVMFLLFLLLSTRQ
jgi:hypothetical protein